MQPLSIVHPTGEKLPKIPLSPKIIYYRVRVLWGLYTGRVSFYHPSYTLLAAHAGTIIAG